MATKKTIKKDDEQSDWKSLNDVAHRKLPQAQGFQVEILDDNGNYKRVLVNDKHNPTHYRD